MFHALYSHVSRTRANSKRNSGMVGHEASLRAACNSGSKLGRIHASLAGSWLLHLIRIVLVVCDIVHLPSPLMQQTLLAVRQTLEVGFLTGTTALSEGA